MSTGLAVLAPLARRGGIRRRGPLENRQHLVHEPEEGGIVARDFHPRKATGKQPFPTILVSEPFRLKDEEAEPGYRGKAKLAGSGILKRVGVRV